MALRRMRKEVYKGQLALHREVNSSQRRESIGELVHLEIECSWWLMYSCLLG